MNSFYKSSEDDVKREHSLSLDNRAVLTLSGVCDVDSFNEGTIMLYTSLGELTIKGRELHIDAMSVETGDMVITGDIWSAVYGDRDRKKPVSALGRIFR